MLIQQARDLHVRIHFVYKIFTVSACREPVYVCVASLFSVLLINCQRSQVSRSDQGRSDNGVYACANAYYTIRHMIARVVGGVWEGANTTRTHVCERYSACANNN